MGTGNEDGRSVFAVLANPPNVTVSFAPVFSAGADKPPKKEVACGLDSTGADDGPPKIDAGWVFGSAGAAPDGAPKIDVVSGFVSAGADGAPNIEVGCDLDSAGMAGPPKMDSASVLDTAGMVGPPKMDVASVLDSAGAEGAPKIDVGFLSTADAPNIETGSTFLSVAVVAAVVPKMDPLGVADDPKIDLTSPEGAPNIDGS